MDSIRLTFSSRRIQALINNTYLASLLSFSFFPYIPLSSSVPITFYADSSMNSNLRSGLNNSDVCSQHTSRVSQDSAEDVKAALTIPIPQSTCIHEQWLHLCFPFSCTVEKLRRGLEIVLCPSGGWEKNFPNPAKLWRVSFPELGSVSQL